MKMQYNAARPQPVPAPPQPHPTPPRRTPKRPMNIKWVIIAVVAGGLAFVASALFAITLGLGLIYADGILPGVHAAGVDLGGLSRDEAINRLNNSFQTVTLTDGNLRVPVDSAQFGLTFNGAATADAAYEYGRSTGSVFGAAQAIVGHVDVAPVINIHPLTTEAALGQLAAQFAREPVNAGVRLVDGRIEAAPPVTGRMVNVAGTVAQLQRDPGTLLADGVLELNMLGVEPAVIDASAMVERATRLLASPLELRAYDPVTDESLYWTAHPEQWSQWLVASPAANNSSGLSLTLQDNGVRNFITAQTNTLNANRYINIDQAVSEMQTGIAQERTSALTRIYHHDWQYTVQPGDSFASIALDVGVPFLYIQQYNPQAGEILNAGQVLTIPSPDNFLPLPLVPHKRIIVSMGEQRVRVYEDGNLRWDWLASTGIASSPTAPGVFQIQSHELNAYAGNWNLNMPHFLGIYRPVPGSDFMNGFHGFPTRGSSQLLWTNDLGHPVTYGCILLDSQYSAILYEWAEEGVVVEIRN